MKNKNKGNPGSRILLSMLAAFMFLSFTPACSKAPPGESSGQPRVSIAPVAHEHELPTVIETRSTVQQVMIEGTWIVEALCKPTNWQTGVWDTWVFTKEQPRVLFHKTGQPLGKCYRFCGTDQIEIDHPPYLQTFTISTSEDQQVLYLKGEKHHITLIKGPKN